MSLAGSLLVHGVMVFALVMWRADGPPNRRLAESSTPETVLDLGPLPAAQPESPPDPQPAPPPEPPPDPAPRPEPLPGPTSSLVLEDKPPDMAPAPAVPPGDAPPAAPRRIVPVDQAPPPAPAPAPMPASFAGVKADRAGRIVYVIDASGAMTTSLRYVKEEFERSLARLDPAQSFQVVIFREEPERPSPDALPDDPPPPAAAVFGGSNAGLLTVSPESRRDAARWLEAIEPSGRSEPLAGLRAALALEPDLIFLLTRSIRRTGGSSDWGAGNDATMQALDRLNPVESSGRRRTVIKTIQFLDDDPTGLLRRIADVHGDGAGSYTVLGPEALK